MRKSKDGVFRGAWMDGRVNEQELRLILRNEVAITEQGKDAVIATVSRAMEVWRFELKRQTLEPQPKEWAGLVGSIRADWPMDAQGVETLRRQVGALPLAVLAVLDSYLFLEHGIGRTHLFDRMWPTPAEQDVALVRSTLEGLRESLTHVRGRLGRKRNVAEPLRHVVAELRRQGLNRMRAAAVASELLNKSGILVSRSPTGLSGLLGKKSRGNTLK